MRDRRRGPHFAPVLTAGGFALWWWLVVIAGAAVVVRSVLQVSPEDILAAGPGYWLLVGFVVLGELRPVVASKRTDPDGVNLATAFLFAVLLVWGFDLAIVSVVLATAIGEAARRKRVFAAVFNISQYTLSYLAAALVLAALHGSVSPTAPGELRPSGLGIVFLAASAYHFANLGIVGTAIGLIERRRLRDSLRGGFVYYTVTTGAMLGMSPLVVVVLKSHWGFVPLLLLPLYLLWTSAKMTLELEHRSLTDGLTGVANRARLADLVTARIAAVGDDGPAAVCVLDLDRFKEINDTLGHATGDALLRVFAERLEGSLREGDSVARLGGDEFALLLNVDDLGAAERVVERIAEIVTAPYDIGGMRLEVELSAGVVLLPDHGRDVDLLLRRADAAMYEAKAGGETVCRFRDELDGHTPSRLQLLADLRRGLSADELELHYQPQVAVPDGAVLGLEALVRWRHPRLGLLLPGEFLPLADRTATMRLVTGAVLELALLQLARWQEMGLEVPVAINVSLHDLADGGFADTITAGLASHGLAADRLNLEVTEGALVSDPARVLATLDKLDAAGIRLSLDDFGTGHASLTRLKNLPVGEVKIDRLLIVDLAAGNVQDMAVVRSVVDLARALSLRSVAEGVETSAQWDALVELGCDALQGWYVAPAMPPDAATDWLMEHIDGRRPADRQAGRDATAGLSPHVGAAPDGARAARS